MTEGVSLDSLLNSLSGFGSASSNLADLSITGKQDKVIPLIDYGEFSQHIFFGDALRRYRAAIKRIEDDYPIGSSAEPDVSSLCAENIYKVDKFLKESDGFDRWILNELSKNTPINGVKNSITAASTNDSGETVPLIHIVRNANNAITGSQTAVADSLSARAENFEKENREQFNQQSGTSIFINSTSTSVHREITVYGVTGERTVTRAQKLSNLLPEVLFFGDSDEILEKTLAAIADQIDELKLFIETIPNVKRISYDDYDRTPDKFLPVVARAFGVELFDGASNIDIARSLVLSASGGLTSKEITYKVWNRILNNIMHLLKTKGTRETLEAICRIYGVDHNFIKINEYSLFSTPTIVREIEEIDIPVLFSTGDVYVQTTADPATGSARAFDFPANQNFTIELRVSATADATCGATGHVLFRHPLYTIDLNGSGQASIKSTQTASLSAITQLNSSSAFVRRQDQFINVIASRSGNGLNIYLMGLTSSPSGGNDFVFINSGSTTNADVALANFCSTGGTTTFAPYFPGSGSFTGYIHEVRSWNVSLSFLDMEEHTRNFESISFQNSTGSPRNATYSSLSAHYKLRENMVLPANLNFIVDSTTAGNTAVPVNFSSIASKRYRVFTDEKKVVNHYPVGLAVDNDRIRQTNSGTNQKDIGYISISLNPINAVNRQIKNQLQDLNLYDLMGTPEDHRLPRYTSPIVSKWHEVSSQWGLAVSASLTADGVTNNRFKSGGSILGVGISGASGSTIGMVDINTFIKSMNNFNDTFGGMFKFMKQFIPAKTNIAAEGIFIEPHILERSKIKRRFGIRETGKSNITGAITADGNVISYDEGSTQYNSAPSIIEHPLTSLVIDTHHRISDVDVVGAGSANAKTLIASAAATSTFQAYQYRENNVQQTIDNSITSTRQTNRLTKTSSVNSPTFSQTRFGRFLPIRVTPASPALSEVEITLDQLLISPTATTTAANGFINGRVRMLVGGKAFKTDTPSLRFEFPASADGTNLFVAEVGDIDAGQGREIKDRDISITTPLENKDIQFKLTLNDVVTSLSAVNGGRGVTQLIVNDTISGSIGIVPVKVVNLFNNSTYVFRIGINSDTNRDRDLITQITQQGVEKIRT